MNTQTESFLADADWATVALRQTGDHQVLNAAAAAAMALATGMPLAAIAGSLSTAAAISRPNRS